MVMRCMFFTSVPAGPAEDVDTCLCSVTIRDHYRKEQGSREPYVRPPKLDLIYRLICPYRV